MNQPDPTTDSYGYMVWTLLQLASLIGDPAEWNTEAKVMQRMSALITAALDAAGQCGA